METRLDPIDVLLETFRRECDARLSFLETEHFARKEFGLSRGDAPIASLDPYKGGELPLDFLAVQRYRLRNSVIEVTYGHRELIVGAEIFFPSLREIFGLFELLQAAGIDDPDADGDGWVRSAERMQRAISALATSLQKRFSVITNPDEKMVERAWDARRDRVRLEREAHRKAWLERARNMAADEFRKQNYGQVVELLSPFEDILSGSDRRKIGLARKRAVPPKE